MTLALAVGFGLVAHWVAKVFTIAGVAASGCLRWDLGCLVHPYFGGAASLPWLMMMVAHSARSQDRFEWRR